MKPLDYKVLATGSKGNAVRIENIMIDCGIPFAKMKEELYKCNTLLITHSHSDHVKPQTLMRIMSEFPRIQIYGNPDVAYQYHVNTILGTQRIRLKGKREIYVTPIDGVHDVPVKMFDIEFRDIDVEVFYGTDTSVVTNPRGSKFDYIFIESNYDEQKLREISKQYKRKGYDPYTDSSVRHLSTQKCKAFYYINRRDEESPLIELHQSSRFY